MIRRPAPGYPVGRGRAFRLRLHVPPFGALAAAATAALLLLTAIGADGGAALAAAGSGARLTLSGPATAAVNQPFTVSIVARGVKDLAGYEATLRFNPRAMVFGGAEQRNLGLASTGRGVETLGPVERTDGVVIGAWSCATANCVTRAGIRASRGPSGTVVVARLAFTARKAGKIQIALGRVHLVDSQGGAIAMSPTAAAPSLRVAAALAGKAGSPAASRDFTPASLIGDGSVRAVSHIGLTAASKDLNHDGLVTHADVIEAAIAWVRVREASGVCGAAARQDDVTADGCLDVRDVQRIANSMAAHGVKRPHLSIGGTRNPSTIPGGGPIVVTSTGDAPDATPGDGICLTAAGDCTLRAAIVEANLANGPDTIAFNIPGTGVHTITLGSPLPSLSDETGPTTIDGYTQPGAVANTAALASNAQLMIELTTNTAGNLMDALSITSASNVIRGLAMYKFHRGIWLIGPGSHNNLIAGSFIGENAAATYIPPALSSMANGFSLTQGASYNQMGEATLAGRNVISGNAHNGVWLWDEGTDWNVVINAIMGLSPDGTATRRNIGRGVDLNSIASFNRVGGSNPLERNVISGNTSEGVEFSHNPLTNENRAVGNFIGTDLTGETSPTYAANGWSGLHFEDGVTENYAIGNTVANSGCANNAGNIAVETRADGNIIKGNFIGISASGAPLASCLWGIVVRLGAVRNQIGPNNEIANNPIGVWVDGDTSDQNTITRNSIHDNGSGIDLSPLGQTPNDPPADADAGPNDNLDTPLLVSAGTIAVSGTACATCRVEIFRATGTAGSWGQGKTFLAAVTTDASGAFNVGIAGLVAGDLLTATTTDGAGNTSEFSNNAVVVNESLSSTVAADTFERTVAGGWGSADTGGAWTSTGGPANDYAVGSGAGTFRFSAASQSRGQLLSATSVADVDMTVQVTLSKPAAGGQEYVYAVLRHQGTDEYRVKLRFDVQGRIFLNASRLIGTTESDIGTNLQLALTQATPILLRASVSGSNPAVIRAKAWAAGSTEPTNWQLSLTDASPTLQTAGSLGLRGYLGLGSTNAPISMAFDNLNAVTLVAGSPPPPPPPPPDPTDYAFDSFSRVTTNAWGHADVGGTWSSATNAGDYGTDGGRATIFISGAQIVRASYLAGVAARDVDVTFRFSADSMPTGNGEFIFAVVRRVGGGSEYRVKVRINPAGAVFLHVVRAIHSVETDLGTEVRVPGLVFTPGVDLLFHAQATGASPTTIAMRVWRSDGVEPTTWGYTATDSTAQLQASGGVGIRAMLGANATHSVLFSVDNFRVTAP